MAQVPSTQSMQSRVGRSKQRKFSSQATLHFSYTSNALVGGGPKKGNRGTIPRTSPDPLSFLFLNFDFLQPLARKLTNSFLLPLPRL
jgi:hypothetical protein